MAGRASGSAVRQQQSRRVDELEASTPTRSLADCITIMSEFEFSVHTGASGFVFDGLGHLAGFLILGAAAAAAAILLWTALTETKPGKYLD
jgi:hypothetical protein